MGSGICPILIGDHRTPAQNVLVLLSTNLLLHGLGREPLDEGPRFDGLLPHPVPKMQLVLLSTLKPRRNQPQYVAGIKT